MGPGVCMCVIYECETKSSIETMITIKPYNSYTYTHNFQWISFFYTHLHQSFTYLKSSAISFVWNKLLRLLVVYMCAFFFFELLVLFSSFTPLTRYRYFFHLFIFLSLFIHSFCLVLLFFTFLFKFKLLLYAKI